MDQQPVPRCPGNSAEEIDVTPVIHHPKGLGSQATNKRRVRLTYDDDSVTSPKQHRQCEESDEETVEVNKTMAQLFGDTLERDDCRELGMTPRNPTAGLYSGTENWEHILKFFEETVEMVNQSDETPHVFVCTPFCQKSKSDLCLPKCWEMILATLAKIRNNKFLLFIFTRKGHFDISRSWLQRNFERRFSNCIKVFTSEEHGNYFHCKWVARVERKHVEIIVTSANVTDSHLQVDPNNNFEQIEFMMRGRIPFDEFSERYLNPIMDMCALETAGRK